MSTKTGIVIPSRGDRTEFLKSAVRSIRKSGDCYILIVKPPSVTLPDEVAVLVDEILDQSKAGLAAAINEGIGRLPGSVQYTNWLGDDDLLEERSLEITSKILDANPKAAMVFGRCLYMDSNGRTIGVNRSGVYALSLMRFGPCLVPQPGSLFRREFFERLGGLDEGLKFAFDLDLFLRLHRVAKVVHTKSVLASFRWHESSLTVANRRLSIQESRAVRERNLPPPLRKLSFLWEVPGCWASQLAGELITKRIKATSLRRKS